VPPIFNAVAYCRLDSLSVIDRERNDFDAILIIDDTVPFEFLDGRCDALWREFFVFYSYFDVEGLGSL